MRPQSHTYAFRGLPERLLFAGSLPSGNQVLVGPIPPTVIALEFDHRGVLIATREAAPTTLTDRGSLEKAVRDYFDSLHANAGTIRILRLDAEQTDGPLADLRHRHDFAISIDDYPLGLEDPEGYSLVDQDPEEYRTERDRWFASGSYVLNWGDGYYVNGEGNVFST